MSKLGRPALLWVLSAAVGLTVGSGTAFGLPSQDHRHLQDCGTAVTACAEEIVTDGRVGCLVCSSVISDCIDSYTTGEQGDRCFPCGSPTDEEIEEFYEELCGGSLTDRTLDYLTACSHPDGLFIDCGSDAFTSEDDFSASEDDFTTTSEDDFSASEDDFTTTSEDDFSASEDDFATTSEDDNGSYDTSPTPAQAPSSAPVPASPPSTPADNGGGTLLTASISSTTGLSLVVGIVLFSATFGQILA